MCGNTTLIASYHGVLLLSLVCKNLAAMLLWSNLSIQSGVAFKKINLNDKGKMVAAARLRFPKCGSKKQSRRKSYLVGSLFTLRKTSNNISEQCDSSIHST